MLNVWQVSNAYIAGMRTDLKLTVPYRYSLITLVFFISYVIFQPPMTYLCRKIGPRVFLPGLCFIWGCVIIGFGFADSWTTLVALRLLLGLLESGYFPGKFFSLHSRVRTHWSSRNTHFSLREQNKKFYLIIAIRLRIPPVNLVHSLWGRSPLLRLLPDR